MEHLPYILAILFAAGMIQGLAGFGSGLIAVPAIALVLPMTTVVPMMTLAGTVISLMNIVHLRRAIEWQPIKLLVLGYLIGTPMGLVFLIHAPRDAVLLGLGLFLTGYALMALAGRQPQNRWLREARISLGAIAGALGSAFSTAGPPVVLHVNAQTDWPADKQKVVLALFFLATSFITIAAQAGTSLITGEVGYWALIAAPALTIGTAVGIQLYRKLGRHNYRRITYGLILLMGLSMLIRTLIA